MPVLPIGVCGHFWAAAFVQQVASPNRQFQCNKHEIKGAKLQFVFKNQNKKNNFLSF